MRLALLTELLGWASILNIGFLVIATICLVAMRDTITSIHSKMFNLPKEELPRIYMTYLSNYKVLTLVFMVCPYLALKIIGY